MMEYQKIKKKNDRKYIKSASKFKTKNYIEVNIDSWEVYNTNSQIRFKTSKLRSGLCDYSDTYILVKGNYISPKYGSYKFRRR